MDKNNEVEKLNKFSVSSINLKIMVQKFRDLTLVDLDDDTRLVIACDSNASNGEKINDFKKNKYEESTVSVIKVPIMEVLASGATPFVLIDNLCMEMEPTGKRIIAIIKAELARSLPDLSIAITGSTEDNFPTTQSGFGITVIGILNPERNRLGTSEKGDSVYCVGYPQSGIDKPYYENTYSVCGIDTVYALSKMSEIHEILPVGSKGVLYEANQLAFFSGNQFILERKPEIDENTSAGSSTAVLITAKNIDELELSQVFGKPITKIGSLK